MTTRAEVTEIAVEASRLSGIPQRHFEKDYYVTQALRAIFAEMSDRVIFKGGTSLSKAYSLIDRFSEDIDLLIDPPATLDNAAGINSILDRIVELAVEGIGGEVTTREMKREDGLASKTNLKPIYGSAKQSGISSDIQIESGRRGGPMPTDRRPISPMATKYMDLDAPDFADFDVVVLHPARTLLEKLLAVDGLGRRLLGASDEKVSGRAARHFYDIHALLDETSPAHDYLRENTGATTELIRDCEAITTRWYGAQQEPFEGSLSDSSVFLDDSIQVKLSEAYARTCSELCYPDAAVPSWAEVLDRVQLNREILTVIPS